MSATDPKLAQRALQIALTDELPTNRAVTVVPTVARDSGHPELAWQFAKANMKQLLAKADALSVNSYAPSLFNFFSDPARIAELEAYAKADLPPAAAKPSRKRWMRSRFRADFKKRLVEQIARWGERRSAARLKHRRTLPRSAESLGFRPPRRRAPWPAAILASPG